MINNLEISREQIEAVAKEMDRLGYGHHEHHAESILHAILKAAPVVERQEPVAYRIQAFDKDNGHMRRHSLSWRSLAESEQLRDFKEWIGDLRAEETPLYDEQPAPVAVPDGWKLVPIVATLEMKNAGWQECERQGIDPEAIEMQTVWTAMHLNAPACLDKVKEMNQ